jgi:hypothetical protein
MWRQRRLREGEEGKRAKSVAPEKNHLVGLFFHFAKSKIANFWMKAIFLFPVSFWEPSKK